MKIDKTEFCDLPSFVFNFSDFAERITNCLIPMAARPKAPVCDRSLARIAGSNTAGGMDVCTL
jgi:hypothetical protein